MVRSSSAASVASQARSTLWLATVVAFGALAFVVFAASLTACNTTEGVGRDIESVGDGIEDAASDAKD